MLQINVEEKSNFVILPWINGKSETLLMGGTKDATN